MHKILFRGKPKNELIDWVYGYYFYSELTCKHYIMGESKDYGYNCIEVIPETVGQYTELNDKNGTKIFEGDIVQTNKFFLSVGLNAKYVIEYDVKIACFIGTMQKGCIKHFTTFQNDSDQFEVIGNIHDNPELLNGEDGL